MLEHADRFEDGQADEQAILHTKDDGRLVLRGGRRWQEYAGRRIRVRGRKRGDAIEEPQLLAAGGRDTAATGGPPAAPAGESDPVPRRLAVLLVSTPEDAAAGRRWDPAEPEQVYFSGERSAAAYFRTLSFGRIDFSGDVLGWYDIQGDGAACNYYAIAAQAEAAATAAGADMSAYDHVAILKPRDEACSWSGLGQMPGRYTWINGRPRQMKVPAHELGHNLGVHHAGALGCSDAGRPTALTGACVTTEYGDPYSVMGASLSHLLSNWHRTQLGLIPSEQRRDVVEDGVHELTTVNDDKGGTKLLRVPRAGGESWLTFEVRTPLAPFAFEPEPAGVVVRSTPSYELRGISGLVDTTPGSAGGLSDAPLQPGQVFEDPATRSVVRVERIEGGVARVRVGFLPSVPLDLAGATEPGAARLTWRASDDDTAVARYEIERDGVLAGSATRPAFTDLPPAGVHTYRVHAVDGAGNRAASTTVTLDVPPPPPRPEPAQPPAGAAPVPQAPELAPPVPSLSADRRAPTITLLARRLGRDRRLPIRLADDRGAVRLQIRLDGRIAGRSARARLPRHALRGRHRVDLRATDTAGNARVLRLRLRDGRISR